MGKSLPVLYSQFYKEGQALLDKYNPCQINKETDSCAGGYKISEGLCCKGCEYLGSNGCTVESLACKLWLCGTVAYEYNDDNGQVRISKVEEELHKIKIKAMKKFIPLHIRASKEETLKERKDWKEWVKQEGY